MLKYLTLVKSGTSTGPNQKLDLYPHYIFAIRNTCHGRIDLEIKFI